VRGIENSKAGGKKSKEEEEWNEKMTVYLGTYPPLVQMINLHESDYRKARG
jgi:predicted patatin/cPLA2 family phospholipase